MNRMTKIERLLAALTFLCVLLWVATFVAVWQWWAGGLLRGATIAVFLLLCHFIWRAWSIVRTGTVPFARVGSRRKVLYSALAAVFWALIVVCTRLDGLVQWISEFREGEVCFAIFTDLSLVALRVTVVYFAVLAFLRSRSLRRGRQK